MKPASRQPRRWLFSALAAVHLGLATRATVLLRDEIGLILELLSRRACPAGVMQLLWLATAGAPSLAGTAGALALTPAGHAARPPLVAGLAAHACISSSSAWPRRRTRRVDNEDSGGGHGGIVARTQPPLPMHALTIAACAPILWKERPWAARRSISRPGCDEPREDRRSRLPQRRQRLSSRRGVMTPAAMAVGVSAAAALAPAALASAVLHCAGQTLELPAHGVHAVGASLLPLGVGAAVLVRYEGGGAPSGCDREERLPSPARDVLASALALGGLAQAAVALCGTHADALCWVARVALASACGGCAAVAASVAAAARD